MTLPIDELIEKLGHRLRLASPLPWEWYNGCSWWRLATVESNGCKTVVCPTIDSSDGHPNLNVSREDRELINDAVNHLPDLLAALSSLQERIRKLEEALKPFAEAADRVEQGVRDDYPIEVGLFMSEQPLVGDFRRARALLSGAGE